LEKLLKFFLQVICFTLQDKKVLRKSEELFQDGVKQVASAYGALINNANEAGKGRYSDDGYFKDAERYLTSGVAGAIGGPMGGHKVDLSPITSTVL
jgi:hypothetical protein